MQHESGGFTVAGNRERLNFKFFRLVEGEAEGRFAISALVLLVVASLLTYVAFNVFLH
jgi:hypothetical protein